MHACRRFRKTSLLLTTVALQTCVIFFLMFGRDSWTRTTERSAHSVVVARLEVGGTSRNVVVGSDQQGVAADGSPKDRGGVLPNGVDPGETQTDVHGGASAHSKGLVVRRKLYERQPAAGDTYSFDPSSGPGATVVATSTTCRYGQDAKGSCKPNNVEAGEGDTEREVQSVGEPPSSQSQPEGVSLQTVTKPTKPPTEQAKPALNSMLSRLLALKQFKVNTARGPVQYTGGKAEKFMAALRAAAARQHTGSHRFILKKSISKCSTVNVDRCRNTSVVQVSMNRTGGFSADSVSQVQSGRNGVSLVANDSERVYVSVKTASALHDERLPPMLLTWLQTIDANQVHIVTDVGGRNSTLAQRIEKSGFNIHEAVCPSGHGQKALCCKSGIEHEQFYVALEQGKAYDWFCHFDDDAYVNVPNLVAVLRRYNHSEDMYLGHYPLDRWSKLPISNETKLYIPDVAENKFAYALGPAYCISRQLMDRLVPYVRGSEKFTNTCVLTGFPDDAALGIVIDLILGVPLTEVSSMLNHLDHGEAYDGAVHIEEKKPEILDSLVTIGYHGNYRICIPNATFCFETDPTRFLSYHCRLYPTVEWCQSRTAT